MKWEHNHILQITKVIHINYWAYIFQHTPENSNKIKIWQPPIQPDIILFNTISSSIPQTIIGGP